MPKLPKSSAEILAAARASNIQIQPRKPKHDHNQAFQSHLSTFPSKSDSVPIIPSESRSFHEFEKSWLTRINSVRFNDPVTPETLKAALEIKEGRLNSVEEMEVISDDALRVLDFLLCKCNTFHTPFEASGSEPDSLVDNLSGSQMGMPLSPHIQDAFDLLRDRGLSPFDLVLEILDEDKPQYSHHRIEFYKEGNQKLEKILNVINASTMGKRKLQTWVRQPPAIALFCDVISGGKDGVRRTGDWGLDLVAKNVGGGNTN